MKVLFTINQAAEMLSISRKTLEREMKKDRFPRPLKIGSGAYVARTDIERYVEMLEAERKAHGGATRLMQLEDEKRERDRAEIIAREEEDRLARLGYTHTPRPLSYAHRATKNGPLPLP